MKKIFLLIIIGVQSVLLSQPNTNYRDTSYTPYSAFKQAIKEYPSIKIVYPVLPDSVNALRNISYVKYGQRKLSLDVFNHSRNNTDNPAIVLVHGGGWRTGSKANMYPMALALAREGYIAITVEYRLAPEAIFPAAVIDIKNSIKWLKVNANKFGVDTNRIAILGCSAGGQLASLVAYSFGENDFEDENYPAVSSNVNVVLNIDGLMDFLGNGSEEFDEIPDPSKPRAAHQWFGSSQIERPDLWKKGSSIHYIKPESPPIIFINSSRPRFHAGRDKAIEKLKKHNIYYEVHTIENTPHPFWLFHPWFNQTTKLVKNYLKKVL